MLALVSMWTACSAVPAAGPPAIFYGEEECGHCRMIVSEAKHAAAVVTAEGESFVFDDVGCLLRWREGQQAASLEASAVWVHDVDDVTWIEAENALFVKQPAGTTPMGSGWTARRAGGNHPNRDPAGASWVELVSEQAAGSQGQS